MKMRDGLRNVFGVAVLLAAAPASSAAIHDTLILGDAAQPSVQVRVIRTTGGIDTTGWVLIAVVRGPDAALVREGQLVRAFSVNSRTRMHLARVTRVTKQQNGVRVEATLETRVLGIYTRYLMEILTESI
jgi:hypothetical protein